MEQSDDAGELLDLHFPDRRFPPGQLGMTQGARDALTHDVAFRSMLRDFLGVIWRDPASPQG